MSRKFCSGCGARLTRENSYKNRKRHKSYRRLCKECDKKKRIAYREKYGQKKRVYYLKAINRESPIEFSTYAKKREFLLLRRQQSLGARPAIGFSSRVRQQVEQVIEERDRETKTVHRYQKESRCNECDGLIRYDDRGFKVCESCGLLAELFTLSNELGADQLPNDLPAHEYYSHARQDKSSMEGSA